MSKDQPESQSPVVNDPNRAPRNTVSEEHNYNINLFASVWVKTEDTKYQPESLSPAHNDLIRAPENSVLVEDTQFASVWVKPDVKTEVAEVQIKHEPEDQTKETNQQEKEQQSEQIPDAPPLKKQKKNASLNRVPLPTLPGVPVEQNLLVPDIEIVTEETEFTLFDLTSIPDEIIKEETEFTPVDFTPVPDEIVKEETEFTPFDFTSTFSTSLTLVERSTSSPVWLDSYDDDEIIGLKNVDPGSDDDDPNDVYPVVNEEYIPEALSLVWDEMDKIEDLKLKESSDPDQLNFDWCASRETFVGKQEEFNAECGPTFNLEGLTPLDVFLKIWDSEIINIIVQESNRYGRGLFARANKSWTDLNGNDIWTFLALIMVQSLVILPNEREFWYPCIPWLKIGNFHDIMPYKKFMLIEKCLHFVDNNTLTKTDGVDRKLEKIRPIIELLNDRFSSLYLPDRYIAIDESLMHWKGRPSNVQRIAKKAARVGIKSYELYESRTGYLWKMLIYTGKEISNTTEHNEPEGVTSKIVHNLVRPLLNKGHTLIMDDFFNSPLLSRILKSKKTDTFGTLRLQRKFVPETLRNLTKLNTRQGEVVYSRTEDLIVSVWHDATIIASISTYHSTLFGLMEKTWHTQIYDAGCDRLQ